MKFYRRNPDAALAGMAELTFEQIGAYCLLLELLYSRDGVVPDNDRTVADMLRRSPRAWRRLKGELMAKGKVHVTTAGMLTANGVERTRTLANLWSNIARHSANVRWDKYKKTKEINDRLMRERNASYKLIDNNSSTNVEAEGKTASPQGVGEKQPFNPAKVGEPADTPQKTEYRSAELRAVMQRKGWI